MAFHRGSRCVWDIRPTLFALVVEESELMEAQNVVDYTAQLRQAMPEDIVIEYLHGRQKAKEKNEIMERFAGNLKFRCSCLQPLWKSVLMCRIATVMMIEDAQRFGLAQLHQLRGTCRTGGCSVLLYFHKHIGSAGSFRSSGSARKVQRRFLYCR